MNYIIFDKSIDITTIPLESGLVVRFVANCQKFRTSKFEEIKESQCSEEINSTSSESSLKTFGEKIKHKWDSAENPEDMKLIAPLGSDLSEEEQESNDKSGTKRKEKDSSEESDPPKGSTATKSRPKRLTTKKQKTSDTPVKENNPRKGLKCEKPEQGVSIKEPEKKSDKNKSLVKKTSNTTLSSESEDNSEGEKQNKVHLKHKKKKENYSKEKGNSSKNTLDSDDSGSIDNHDSKKKNNLASRKKSKVQSNQRLSSGSEEDFDSKSKPEIEKSTIEENENDTHVTNGKNRESKEGSIRNSPEKESKDNIKNKKKVSPKTSEDCDTNGKKRESKGGSVRKSPEKEIKDNVKNKEKVSTKPNENSSEISLAEVKEESDSEHLIESEVESVPVSKKFVSLGSSSEDESTKTSVVKTCDRKKKAENETATTNKGKNQPKNVFLLDSSDEENEPEADKPNNLPILLQSSDEENESPVGKTKDKSKSSVASGSIENLSSAASSDEEIFRKKNTRTKKSKSSDSDFEEGKADKNKKKRKLVRCASSSNDSDESGDGEGGKSRKGSGKSPGKGRKNIKKIKKDVAESTKEAAEEEKERRKRIEDRQKLFNQVFEVKESKTLDKLVLDFDAENKKELLSVNPDLVAKMKPHQAKGVKFMWDSCFESISDCKKKKGSGCILAHCMGLGKTFQVISLVHTLLMNEDTQVRTVMVVCPLSTVLNWYNEFDKWLDNIEGGSSIDVYHLTRLKSNPERARELRHWQNTGGVLIMGYEMFRNLTAETAKKFRAKMKKDFQETLVDPGADIIVCDEGHMLKNEQTALSKAMGRVRTLRRIVLTGTPMQNNLVEYHCMVQFVKPNLLGTKKEFLNRFVNPITNGQFVDSTERDVSIMKRRAHVLHKMLEGLVQRFDYNVLTPFLPPKHEYVVSICLSELQVKMYQHYLDNYSQRSDKEKAGSRLFQDWQALGRIWTHPRVVKISSDRAAEKRAMLEESDEEGSLKDFIDDSDEETTSESESESAGSGSGSAKCNAKKRRVVQTRRKTRSNATNDAHLESEEEENAEKEVEENQEKEYAGAWWSEFLKPEDLNDIRHSGKLMLLFGILKESEMIEDKVLVFSQSLFSLDLIEYFLDKIDAATQEDRLDESLGNHQGNWSKGLDYFRLDGSTSSDNRNLWCKAFNREDNPRARLFLISTRAGGLGINLTAANRVIIFDASWNPSHDVQSIFRVYRFGQKKPCYVYRFIASGTMEEKVYDRQVAKQSISNRVVDEQQVHRHFTSSDLNELYTFTPPSKPEDRPTPALPKDVLMAELLAQFKDWIEKYHEHDSLLENVAEEELNEEERKLAWEDYETEKKRGFLPNYANNAPGQANNSMHMQIEIMRQNLKTKFPTMPEPELNQMLIQQVSMLMRHQHMLQQQQKMAQQQYQQQQMAAKVMQMRQQQQQAQLQMKQMYQKVPASVLMNQQAGGNAGVQPSLLSSFLNMPSRSNMQMPGMSAPYPQMTPNFKEMEKMRQRYMASKNPGVVITEVTDETPKPSSS